MKKSFGGYCDLHTHSNLSDASSTVPELLHLAAQHDIRFLALSDHNRLVEAAEYEVWSALEPGITLVPGCEMSASYTPPGGSGKPVEVHLNILFYRPGCAPQLQMIANHNQKNDRRDRVTQILEKLRSDCGIDLCCTYDDLLLKYPTMAHVGRMVVARELLSQGYVNSVSEAFDTFLSEHTGKAFVPETFQYASFHDVIEAAHKDMALVTLCHLFYYDSLSREQKEELVRSFKEANGEAPAALEVFYSRYSKQQREYLASLAAQHELLVSCGSDFHGQADETLNHHYPAEIYCELLEARNNYYRK